MFDTQLITNSFKNLDLLSVGITVSAITVLGFTVFINNPKSITNKSFLIFSITTILYGVFNYISYKILTDQELALIFLRITIFSATWHAFSFFQLFYVFPSEHAVFSKTYKYVIIPITSLVSFLTLTPWALQGIKELSSEGRIIKVVNGPAMAIFGLWVIFLIIGGIAMLYRKSTQATEEEGKKFKPVFVGVVITFSLLLIFNLILPSMFDNSEFISLGALFMLPFITFTFYSITKRQFLDVKIIATEIFAIVLSIIVLFDVIVAKDLGTVILRSGIFLIVLSFNILIVKSVWNEVKQKEKLEILAKKLQSTNDRLKELDMLKSQFLSFASHQVKAPMAIVKGYADLIAKGDYGEVPEEVKNTANKIKNSADKMISLVEELLNLRKIEEGKIEYDMKTKDITFIIKEVVDELQTLADDKKLHLNFETPTKQFNAKIDEGKFKQIIQNLVENSIKYTEEGWIKVTIEEKDDSALITVSDSGIGMSKETTNDLFEQFHRGSGKSRSIKGTGLGLYIAKKMIEAHNGKVWAESEGEGKGSQFHVQLPLEYS
ncbi:MAG: hypothetical protein COV29_03795 [Candidatus Yanofskybacteria bacterium CG10_big_fil_rev_8_21_14_0_10_36_16]|uniref:histidine kinase n=1 Tax=Candidatus Yanofskybacteria bacterium CG10_big_fil_rev_8_21_14_0_10_36_16 TaxID=1975096 RepID=A0A2J0QA82_9BACT|nr:MAG: hypothetical protein COV29_03795 [Candidatus Yanofskybacteria bacterium CG10_big_fil_rev_8_21_14_0_10_36_16]